MQCKTCGETDVSQMMNKGKGRKAKSLCKNCHNKNTIARGRDNRAKYIAYKDGKCVRCGYDKCADAMDFHHTDASQKDPTFQSMRYWGLEKAKKELDKCLLVCCRCHGEIHAELFGAVV